MTDEDDRRRCVEKRDSLTMVQRPDWWPLSSRLALRHNWEKDEDFETDPKLGFVIVDDVHENRWVVYVGEVCRLDPKQLQRRTYESPETLVREWTVD